MKLLIVDDEQEVLEGMRFFFEAQGVHVMTAQGGHEALALVRECRPKLIMLDIKMRGMDGLEILRRVKEFDPGITVVMVTGLSDDGLEEACVSLGATQVLHKPVRIEELQEIIDTLYGRGSFQSTRR